MQNMQTLDRRVVLDCCPTCGGGELYVLEPEHDFHSFTTLGDEFVFRIGSTGCAGCGFIFLNPRAGQEQMYEYYQRQSRIPRRADQLAEPYAALLDKQARFIRTHWTPREEPRILDVGCAEGFFLARLAREAVRPRLEGVDPSPVYASAARTVLPDAVIHEGMLEDVRLPAAAYDVITLRHVLEHLQDPLGALRLLRSLLRPDGLLHLELPDVSQWPPSIASMYHHEHLNYFTPGTMAMTLSRAGLAIVRLEAARDNPMNSGFSYPIQRVLARPAESLDGEALSPPEDPREIHLRYASGRAAYLNREIEPIRRRIEALRAEGRRVGIFGAGPHTMDLLAVLGLPDTTWSAFFDNNSNKVGRNLRGTVIQRPSRESMMQVDTVLVSSAEFETEIVEQIRSFDLSDLEVLTLYS